MPERYWLFDWMDENGVRSDWHIEKVLKSRPLLRDLKDRVQAIEYTTEALDEATPGSTVLVAGRGIDLSADLECGHWECKKKQVDRLFSRVWHYFDKIVVVGLEARELQKVHDLANEEMVRDLEHNMRLLLYLRQIGAEDMLIFRQKPPACRAHSHEQLQEAGFTDSAELVPRLADQLRVEGQVRIREHDDHYHYAFDHPTFMHSAFGTISRDVVRRSDGIEAATALAVVNTYISRLSSDVMAAKYLKNPFGTDLGYYRILLSEFARPATVDDVTLELKLPVLEGVTPRDLLALRRQESASFERFRNALTVAISARVSAAGSVGSEQVAREVERDVIRPALADIDQRLDAARSVLSRKAGLGLAIGAIATTCGLVLNVPLLTVTGVGTAMTALQAEYKHIEEKRDIELADMYFLWRAAHEH